MTADVTSPPETPSRATERTGVPWTTVLALGALLAYTDGFWTTTLRVAVGAIERTSAPFSGWLRESTLMVPLFALAVLAALVLARRRFGPTLRGRSLLAAALLVACAGALAGVAELVVSSVFDYRLQLAALDRMGNMHGRCVGACLDGQRDATLLLQVKSVGYGSVILLLSNLVFVGWALAFMGGRLRVERPTGGGLPRVRSRYDDARILVALALAGSAVIHAAVVPEHVVQWRAAGLFFVLLTVLQLLAADLVLTRPGRVVWVGVAALSAGPLLLWLCSRTVGLPFGPGAGDAEAVGLADLAAGLLELVSLAAAVAQVRARAWTGREPATAHVRGLAVLAAVAVTAIGVGSGLGLYDGAPGHGAPTEHQAVESG